MSKNDQSLSSSSSSSLRPNTIILPTSAAAETLFSGSPNGLISNFFDPDSDCRSFSQLLTDAISNDHRHADMKGSEQTAVFTVPSGMSHARLLNSPAWNQGPLGVSIQQTLALVSAQANSHFEFPTKFSSGLSAAPALALPKQPPSNSSVTTHQQVPSSLPDYNMKKESPNPSYFDQRSLPSSIVVDKPADDGYNWRKYGQKQVKGSEFPRSYYKCTQPKCPVKKKIERSLDGQITEIIYKGQHNHQPPQLSKRGKDSGYLENSVFSNDGHTGNLNRTRDRELNSENVSGSIDREDEGDDETRDEEENEDEPDAKRKISEARVAERAVSHRTVLEPKIIVQTTSEVDILDDGYRWRKYGKKVVNGNPYPRSYYKCTSQACNVHKHVERAASDPKAVITTYEGKHNHDVPAARNSSHSMVNNNALQLRPQNAISDKHHSYNDHCSLKKN